jgi:hypothetical protein
VQAEVRQWTTLAWAAPECGQLPREPKAKAPPGDGAGLSLKIEQGGRLLRHDNAQGRGGFPGVARAFEKIAS